MYIYLATIYIYQDVSRCSHIVVSATWYKIKGSVWSDSYRYKLLLFLLPGTAVCTFFMLLKYTHHKC